MCITDRKISDNERSDFIVNTKVNSRASYIIHTRREISYEINSKISNVVILVLSSSAFSTIFFNGGKFGGLYSQIVSLFIFVITIFCYVVKIDLLQHEHNRCKRMWMIVDRFVDLDNDEIFRVSDSEFLMLKNHVRIISAVINDSEPTIDSDEIKKEQQRIANEVE